MVSGLAHVYAIRNIVKPYVDLSLVGAEFLVGGIEVGSRVRGSERRQGVHVARTRAYEDSFLVAGSEVRDVLEMTKH